MYRIFKKKYIFFFNIFYILYIFLICFIKRHKNEIINKNSILYFTNHLKLDRNFHFYSITISIYKVDKISNVIFKKQICKKWVHISPHSYICLPLFPQCYEKYLKIYCISAYIILPNISVRHTFYFDSISPCHKAELSIQRMLPRDICTIVELVPLTAYSESVCITAIFADCELFRGCAYICKLLLTVELARKLARVTRYWTRPGFIVAIYADRRYFACHWKQLFVDAG